MAVLLMTQVLSVGVFVLNECRKVDSDLNVSDIYTDSESAHHISNVASMNLGELSICRVKPDSQNRRDQNNNMSFGMSL